MNVEKLKYTAMNLTVFYSSPEKDADLLYFGGFYAPDPFLAFEIGGRKGAILSPLELSRARKSSQFDEILSLEEVLKSLESEKGVAAQILWLASERKATGIRLPEDFPARIARELETGSDYPVTFADRPVCRERLHKTLEEQESIRRVNAVVSGAFGEVERILRESVIEGKFIHWQGEVLTSETLRSVIAVHCLRNGCIASGTIAAGGVQACDPHEQGSGPLPAHELIIVDIFPREERSGYHGDMTRTYLKGTANSEQRRLVDTVRKSQALAIKSIAAGVDGKTVHESVVSCLEENEYKTGKDESGYYGFFHGTGHGLGLEIHEEPRVSRQSCILEEGMVTTVEPGLYYPSIGGCRIEDVVCVTADGVEFLSDHPYDWMIE